MRKPTSVRALEALGRVRLGRHFYMREFLCSEIGNIHRIPNIPENPDLAIETGRVLCETLLDPLVETFGSVSVRSGYRSPALNAFGNAQGLSCARNDYNWSRHIWDRVDAEGRRGACTSLVIPWFADQYERGRDWRDLAWWMAAHLTFHDIWFFPRLCAFNIGWRDDPAGRVFSYIAPKGELAAENHPQTRYSDFPPFRGLDLPRAPLEF